MAQTIWSGLTMGAIFALIASGFTVSLIPTGVFNFAQGALVVGGTFLTYQWLAKAGMPVIPAVAVNVVIGVVAGALCELITVRPLRLGRAVGGGPSELVTTVGMATALVGVYGLAWGYDPLRVPFHGPTEVVTILGVRMEPVEILLVLGAVAIAFALHAWFKYTRLGHACRAVAEDRDAATLRGVNVNLLSIGAFAAAGGLAGLAAFAVGPVTLAIPTLAHTLALGGFVALAVGGEQSFVGGLIGGFGTGIVSALATRYIGADATNISVLAVLLISLTVRPAGLGGVAAVRSV